MKLGDKLKNIREQNGLSLKEVAFRIGIAPPYLSQIENNKRTPSVYVLVNLAVVLGVSLDSLFGFDEPLKILDAVKIPVVDHPDTNNILHFVYVPVNVFVSGTERALAIRVKGDDMIGSGILNNSIVVVDKNSSIENGCVVLALSAYEDVMVRHFYRGVDGSVELRPSNINSPCMRFTKRDLKEKRLRLVGGVVWTCSEIGKYRPAANILEKLTKGGDFL